MNVRNEEVLHIIYTCIKFNIHIIFLKLRKVYSDTNIAQIHFIFERELAKFTSCANLPFGIDILERHSLY